MTRSTTLAALAAAAGLTLTGCSEEAAAERSYLSTMHEDAPELVAHFDDDDKVVQMGETVCGAFDDDWSLGELWLKLRTGDETVDTNALVMIGAAVGSLCPEHSDKIN